MECNKGEAVRARGIASNQTDLSHIADSLEDDCQIGFLRHSPRCHIRYVTLRSNELFTRLCNLYMGQFRASYPSFKSTIKAFKVPVEAPKGTTQLQYAVACYISSFFWDLYVSIRKPYCCPNPWDSLYPKTRPRDVDDWQFFPGNILPTDIILTDYRKATTRRFYGAAENRTISHRQWYPEQTIIEVCAPVSSKRHQQEPTSTSSGGSGNLKLTPAVTTDTQQQQQPPSPPQLVSFCQYQLIDWCYHGVVVFYLGVHAQAQALTSFICSVPY
ncbi:hypothetical protein V6N13_015010 [Hibiscus sabdariffa]